MSFDYINNTYGVSARRGGRIEYAPPDNEPRRGTSTGTTNAYLLVRLDGEKRSLKLHPTWCVKYLKVEWIVRLAGSTEKQIWYGPQGEHKYNQDEAQRFKSKAAATRARNGVMRYWTEAKVVEVDRLPVKYEGSQHERS